MMTAQASGGSRRDSILEEATRLFMSQGYDATTTQHIVDAAGISRGLLYYHFTDKEDLLNELVRIEVTPLIDLWRSIAYDRHATAKQKIYNIIDSIQIERIPFAKARRIHAGDRPGDPTLITRAQFNLAQNLAEHLTHILAEGNTQLGWSIPYPEAVAEYLSHAFVMVFLTPDIHMDPRTTRNYNNAFREIVGRCIFPSNAF